MLKKILTMPFIFYSTEEIIASTHAIEVSRNGRYIAFVTFNATDVPFYKFPIYGPVQNQYTQIDKIAYPKVKMFIIVCIFFIHIRIQTKNILVYDLQKKF